MSAPTCGSTRSDVTRKARAQAAPFGKKKRRLNALDDRGGEGETHLQPAAIPKQYNHGDSKNRHHEAEGSMKRDRQ